MLIPRRFNSRSGKDLGFISRSFPSPPLVLLNPKAVTDYYHVAAWLPSSAKEGLYYLLSHTLLTTLFVLICLIEDFAIWGSLIYIAPRYPQDNTHRLCAFLHPSSFASTGSRYRILGSRWVANPYLSRALTTREFHSKRTHKDRVSFVPSSLR